MTEVLDNVEHLEKKIQKLVSYHHALRESNNRLADENKRLIAKLEQEAEKAKRAEHEVKSKHNNHTDLKNLKIKVEEIICEVDNSLNMLSNKSESTL
jgi:seryl-tRNA synthetase